ncbi:hypothetical protein FHU41_001047 [Psychromicrobium silvestre]|uniref:DinB-like domain-containing protein n=1 Tax=Psychromicrobium silvestre TaxID=1645614 RepID=A0A7Y9LSL6_9MICC|nr:DinB family protein [Psychromicrobium silvestre]NYE94826.1 hypothetical protein [Psychromicrobium silvestre]
MSRTLATQLAEQLSWHWENQLRPRLNNLSDEEYFWEPVPRAWNVRRRGETLKNVGQRGSGEFLIDFEHPPPYPAPVTTIAWRLGHVITGVLGERNASHFNGPAVDQRDYPYPGTAADALEQLDEAYQRWISAVSALDEQALAAPCGDAEGEHFGQFPLSDLILHINREVIHHGAEVSLLRDLYRHGLR